jgi:uncharacterized protein YecT (DUF1311 family)
MKTIITSILLLMAGVNTFCQTQIELTNIAKSAFEKTDEELNQVYQKILQGSKNDTIFLRAMKDAQRQWIKFRDAQLMMKYPTYPNADESVLSMCRYYYLEELTNIRVKDLKQWTDGVEEGDVCSGSIRLKSQ